MEYATGPPIEGFAPYDRGRPSGMTGRPLGNGSFSEPRPPWRIPVGQLAQRGGFHGGDSLPILKGPPGSPRRLHDEEDSVPLSEHEQRMLEQMERALYAEDPKFASSLRGSDLRVLHRRRVFKASVGFLVGIGLLLAGVITPYVPLGVGGSVVMILSALLAVHSWRQITSPESGASA